MKRIIIGILLMASMAAWEQVEARKLPAGAYVKTAKIEILSGEPERYKYAMVMLDSLFLNYGPHAEGLSWMAKIMVDMVGNAADLKEKSGYIDRLVAYTDSLHQCCDNEDIKKKYRKNCKRLVGGADSTLISFWRELYNDGVEQVDEIERIAEEVALGVDEEDQEFYDKQVAALTDSCLDNMKMAITLNPNDPRPYIGLGTIFQKQQNMAESINWLTQGLERSEDRQPLLPAIAYNYIEQNDYCSAIPFFREYIDVETDDLATIYNLSICYNNCEMYDSATTMYHRILDVDPENANAYRGLADYHFTIGRRAGDSAREYRAEGQEEARKIWLDRRDERFDSARVYQKLVFEFQPDRLDAAERYGMMCYLVSDFDEAVVAFSRAAELDPSISENWSTLGDCYISSKKFPEAVEAYEQVIELEPDKLEIWQRLSELYVMTGQAEKRKQADKKVAELQ